MRPQPAFALAILLGAITTVACSADHAPTTPVSPRTPTIHLDLPLPGAGDDVASQDLTDRLRDAGALTLTTVRVGRRTRATVLVTNPFDSEIGECKIIIIDNPTTRSFGPIPLLMGGSVMFTTMVSTPVTLEHVRVTGRLP